MISTDHLSELESLRSQIADLTRQLAERDRSTQDLREQSDLLLAIVSGTATETGEEFFTTLVTQLTSWLHIQYAVIGEVQGDHTKKIRTLAVSAGDTLVDNFEYELTHTPCATALTQGRACFNQNVQETFPQFQRLVDLGAESYCAVSIRAKDGAVVGLLVVMDTKPLVSSGYVQSLLAIFAPRVAAEFERKRAEQERTQALADLHNVIEAIPDIVFALDTQGNLVKWNRRLVDVTGYSPEELLNVPALAFVPPEEQTVTAAAVQRAFTEGYAELEGHLLTTDHHLIPYHWTGTVLKNCHGESIGIVGIGRDAVEKKRVEAALRGSEERYRALYDDTPTMYFTLAVDGTVRSVNRFGAEQLGYQAEELIGHSVLRVFHEQDKETVAASLSECLTTPKTTRHWEFRKIRKDGTVIWVRETACAGQSSTGETIVLVTCEDTTERKRVEEELRQRERDLQTALQERERISQDLHDGILQSLFAVGLTLETAKSMMTTRTRKSSGPPLDQAIKQLNLIMREIRNFIAGLGSDLLRGQDLTIVLKQMLASLTETQAIRVRHAIEDRAVKALSTEQSLHLVRVIQEAVSNCIQHGRASEARVSLKLLKQGVRLSVRDNGCGFIQTGTQRTGHGLRNMASRAQKIGGKFSILSKVNEGTRIVLDLPRETADVSR